MHSDKYLTWLLSVLIFFISSSAKYLYLVLFQYFGKEKWKQENSEQSAQVPQRFPKPKW